MTSYKREIMDLSQENRLPVISLYAEFVDIGGLMAYGPSISGHVPASRDVRGQNS